MTTITSVLVCPRQADGTFVKTWGEPGTDPGQFNLPHNLCMHPDGDKIIVSDRENNRAQVFKTSDGSCTQVIPSHRCVSVCVDKSTSNIFLAEQATHSNVQMGGYLGRPDGGREDMLGWTPSARGSRCMVRPTQLLGFAGSILRTVFESLTTVADTECCAAVRDRQRGQPRQPDGRRAAGRGTGSVHFPPLHRDRLSREPVRRRSFVHGDRAVRNPAAGVHEPAHVATRCQLRPLRRAPARPRCPRARVRGGKCRVPCHKTRLLDSEPSPVGRVEHRCLARLVEVSDRQALHDPRVRPEVGGSVMEARPVVPASRASVSGPGAQPRSSFWGWLTTSRRCLPPIGSGTCTPLGPSPSRTAA